MHMRLGTMTSLFRDRRECAEHFGYIESIQRCRKAGFTVLDMNLCALNRRQTTLHLDNWQEQVDEIRNEAERLGCVFSQSHPPYRRGREGTFATAEEEAFFRAMSLRALEITAMLGAKWAVIHPVMDVTADINDVDAHVRYNQQMFAREAELVAKLGVGLAFENMFDGDQRRFGSTAEDLIAIQDSFHSDLIGICWDVGHANRMYRDQLKPIRKLGSRIKALHIDDNLGKDDLHLLPFEGNVPWEQVMHTLYDSGCEADLIYEIRNNANMPEALRDVTARYCYEVGEYLLSLYR